MSYTLALPSKTFLIGEYAILQQGSALIACNKPDFVFTAKSNRTGRCTGIPKGCPADHFRRDHASVFQCYDIEFLDPHQGQGGLGASSAQFLSVYCFIHQDQTIDFSHLLDCYTHYAWNKQGFPPSGADLIAQLTGGLCYVDKNTLRAERLIWPFQDLSFCLLRTQAKIATHEHLKILPHFDAKPLQHTVQECMQAFQQHDSAAFIAAIKQYHHQLSQLGFVAATTQQLLDNLTQHPSVHCAKGCGAMGADIILAVINKNERQDFIDWVSTVAHIPHQTMVDNVLFFNELC